jgi:AGZA family xanthine/uracil permease-like MFS transporter
MLDNIANLVLTVGLLSAVFEFPTKFALRHMIPGTALGVLVGDLLFFMLAFRLARQLGRDVTAMPLGLDTPSTFGMVFFVLGPAYIQAKSQLPADQAALHVWHLGICSIVVSGLFKLVCAAGSGAVRRILPRAGLLGSLVAIALVLISFLPLIEILHYPLVGLVATSVILTTLVARVQFPYRIPGTLAALLLGGGIYYLMKAIGQLPDSAGESFPVREGLLPTEWMTAFRFEWLAAMPDAVNYLPIVIPFALATVVGGIDCTESAAAAGDEYDTNQVIAVEAVATLIAGMCGGVIQTTPYIGHPAYKAMGGRAAYTLATALFVGGAGLLGYFGLMYLVMPKAAVFPILLFIGLEITAQSFAATPRRHYAALAFACVPALAALAGLYADKLLGEFRSQGFAPDRLSPPVQTELDVVRVLASGFIVTSLLWSSGLATLIDRHLGKAAAYFGAAGACSLFGVIHSPLPGSRLFWPWELPVEFRGTTFGFVGGYFATAGLLVTWHAWRQRWPDAMTETELEELSHEESSARS